MCTEEQRTGRKSPGGSRTVTLVGGSAVTIAGPDESRVGLLVSTYGVGGCVLVPDDMRGSNVGIALTIGTPFIFLNLGNCGTLLQKPWQAQIIDGNPILTIIETYHLDRGD